MAHMPYGLHTFYILFQYVFHAKVAIFLQIASYAPVKIIDNDRKDAQSMNNEPRSFIVQTFF